MRQKKRLTNRSTHPARQFQSVTSPGRLKALLTAARTKSYPHAPACVAGTAAFVVASSSSSASPTIDPAQPAAALPPHQAPAQVEWQMNNGLRPQCTGAAIAADAAGEGRGGGREKAKEGARRSPNSWRVSGFIARPRHARRATQARPGLAGVFAPSNFRPERLGALLPPTPHFKEALAPHPSEAHI